MKKYIYLLCTGIAFHLSNGTANAQLAKGEVSLGGSFNIAVREQNEKDDLGNVTLMTKQKEKEMQFIPQVSFGLGHHFVAGVGLGYSYVRTKDVSFGELDTSIIGTTKHIIVGNLFARYFGELGKNFGLYIELDTRYGGGRSRVELPVIDEPQEIHRYTISNFKAAVSPGVYYKMGRFFLDAKFGGLTYDNHINDQTIRLYGTFYSRVVKDRKSKLAFTMTDNVEIGFRWLLHGKKK